MWVYHLGDEILQLVLNNLLIGRPATSLVHLAPDPKAMLEPVSMNLAASPFLARPLLNPRTRRGNCFFPCRAKQGKPRWLSDMRPGTQIHHRQSSRTLYGCVFLLNAGVEPMATRLRDVAVPFMGASSYQAQR